MLCCFISACVKGDDLDLNLDPAPLKHQYHLEKVMMGIVYQTEFGMVSNTTYISGLLAFCQDQFFNL